MTRRQHVANTDYVAGVYLLAQLAMKLRSHLMARLPEYMIPAAFVNMDAFPLNANGKLDRRSLPVPRDDDFARQDYESPQGRIESSLSFIWEDVLSVSNVGRHNDFFAIGGHSLLALKMISRVRNLLGFEMSIGTAFRAPTIAKLALRLVESETTQDESYHVLLPIKTHGSRVPLFCIHPVLGLSWCFMGLYRSISTPNSLSMVYKRVDSTVKEGLPRPSMEWRWITLIRFAVSSHMDLTICLSTRSVAR
ncbi:hypothetical protein BGX31_001694 [Mortierella sp. GBA43]|nr:hypothetical protein BGX31_001694 [Mortierella sp. GBA43]